MMLIRTWPSPQKTDRRRVRLIDHTLCRSRRARLALVTAIVLCPAVSWADDSEIWLRYDLRQRIDENRRWFGALRYRTDFTSGSVSTQFDKFDVRAGMVWQLGDRSRFEVGGGAFYSSFDVVDDLFEARAWQALTLDWPEVRAVKRYVLHHRFMLEQRGLKSDDWSLSLRGRYRLAFAWPLNRYSVEEGAYYVPFSVEAFAKLGGGEDRVFSKQARYTIGLGRAMNKNWILEGRYIREDRRDVAGVDFEASADILELRVRSAARIVDILKAR